MLLRTFLPTVALIALLGCGTSGVQPQLIGIDDRSVQVGGLLEIVVRATVPGTISFEGAHPAGAQLIRLYGDTATYMLRWIPLASDVGRLSLTLALEASSGRVTETVLITVLPSEIGRPTFVDAPYNLLLDLAVEKSASLRVTVKDDDDTSDTLEIVPGTELPGATLDVAPDGKSATFTFTPSMSLLADRCSFGTQLRARDAHSMEALAGIFIEVRNGCGAEPGVLINEILFDPPTGKDVNGDGKFDNLVEEEFVELVNITDHNIELGGATISDAIMPRFTFPTPTTLAPKQAAVVFGGGNPKGFPADVKIFSVSAAGFGNNGLSLNNAGDTVLLRSSDGSAIDVVTYPAACVSCADGINQSVTRQTELSRSARFLGHDKMNGAVGKYSPGRRANGLVF